MLVAHRQQVMLNQDSAAAEGRWTRTPKLPSRHHRTQNIEDKEWHSLCFSDIPSHAWQCCHAMHRLWCNSWHQNAASELLKRFVNGMPFCAEHLVHDVWQNDDVYQNWRACKKKSCVSRHTAIVLMEGRLIYLCAGGCLLMNLKAPHVSLLARVIKLDRCLCLSISYARC